MFKKVIAMALAVALTAAVSIAGTVAYLTAEDSDVNVMTLGNVKIQQIEKQRIEQSDDNVSEDNIEPFRQAKPLYPAVGTAEWAPEYQQWPSGGSSALFEDSLKNVQDKMVFVENTGLSKAYVRTLFAFEAGELDWATFDQMLHFNINDTHWAWADEEYTLIEVDGVKYYATYAVYQGNAGTDGQTHPNGVLAAGETTRPSLLQLFLDSAATNETVESFGDTYDVLVLSQAVQVEGFADAATALNTGFGVPTDVNSETGNMNLVDWFSGTLIPDLVYAFESIQALRGSDGSYIVANDFEAENIIFFGEGTNVTLDLNGKTVDSLKKEQFAYGMQNGGVLHLTGDGTANMGKGFMANKGNAEIVIDGGTYHATVANSNTTGKFHSVAQNNSKIVINGGTFTSDVEDAALFLATSNAVIEINGGFFENTADKTPDLLNIGTNKNNVNRIIIKGGTFVNYNPLEDKFCYTGEWPDSYEQFSGPWILVWDGYKVVSETQANGDVWFTVVPA